MARRTAGTMVVGLAVALGIAGAVPARAQQDALRPIPAAECQQIAGRIQAAAGLATSVSEDDYSDFYTKTEGRSCHIMATASGLSAADANELIAKIGTAFAGWTDDPERGEAGRDAAEKGYVQGSRIASVLLGWEPVQGVICSEQLPLSACKATPQQRSWTAIIDIFEKTR